MYDNSMCDFIGSGGGTTIHETQVSQIGDGKFIQVHIVKRDILISYWIKSNFVYMLREISDVNYPKEHCRLFLVNNERLDVSETPEQILNLIKENKDV